MLKPSGSTCGLENISNVLDEDPSDQNTRGGTSFSVALCFAFGQVIFFRGNTVELIFISLL